MLHLEIMQTTISHPEEHAYIISVKRLQQIRLQLSKQAGNEMGTLELNRLWNQHNQGQQSCNFHK